MDVAEWLRGRGLDRCEIAFRESDIGPGIVRSLTVKDLKEIGQWSRSLLVHP